MYLEKEVFFEQMAHQGKSLGFENMIIGSGPSEQVRQAIETGDFDVEFIEPDLSAPYTRNSGNKLPFVSAAMDTVTESATAIVMADSGGRGTLHAGLSPEDQFRELEIVKKRLQGFIEKPKCLNESMSFEEVHNIVLKHHFDTFPVVDADGKLVGMVTGHQLKRNRTHMDMVKDKMVPLDRVTTSDRAVSIDEAYKIMVEEDINTLPIVDDNRRIAGMYTFTDVQRIVEENSGMRNVDSKGRYVCDIAVPTNEQAIERVGLCAVYLANGGGVVTLDTAQGESLFGLKILKKLKETHPDIDFMVGNVTNPESAVMLVRVGADGVKVGQASGGMCTTFEETGIGRRQLTAVWECSQALKNAKFFDVPVCSDGGIKLHGDPAKAIVVGATSVMIGTKLGGTDEAPSEEGEMPDGSPGKIVRGMGSLPALKASSSARFRYGGDSKRMPHPEGKVEAVPYQGSLASVIEAFRLALRKSLVYAGATDIASFQRNTPVEYDEKSK